MPSCGRHPMLGSSCRPLIHWSASIADHWSAHGWELNHVSNKHHGTTTGGRIYGAPMVADHGPPMALDPDAAGVGGPIHAPTSSRQQVPTSCRRSFRAPSMRPPVVGIQCRPLVGESVGPKQWLTTGRQLLATTPWRMVAGPSGDERTTPTTTTTTTPITTTTVTAATAATTSHTHTQKGRPTHETEVIRVVLFSCFYLGLLPVLWTYKSLSFHMHSFESL